MKIKRVDSRDNSIGVKRFSVPFQITDKCPKCGKSVECSETKNYFSYPRLGVPESVSFICETDEYDECCEWGGEVVLEMRIREYK